MEKITLKKIITRRNRSYCYLVLASVFLALYTLCGAISYQYATPHFVTLIDETIPLITVTAVPLALCIFLFIWILSREKFDLDKANLTFYALTLALLIHLPIYLLYPTIFPSHKFILMEKEGVSYFVYNLIKALNRSYNTFPSLLYTAVLISFFRNLNSLKKIQIFYLSLLVIIIGICLLTLKINLLIDLIGSFIIALTTYWVSTKLNIKSHHE